MEKSRTRFLLTVVLSVLLLASSASAANNKTWPVLKTYDQEHTEKVALPLGGIGTGTISLGGRGELRDWEIMSRPAKGFVPANRRKVGPSFILYARAGNKPSFVRLLEGPIPLTKYEDSIGMAAPNHGFPRFRNCKFQAAYPFGQVLLDDPDSPLDVRLQAFNPLVPGDVDVSSIPVVILKYVLTNKTAQQLDVSVCGTVPNYISTNQNINLTNEKNINTYRKSQAVQGIFISTTDEDKSTEKSGTMSLVTDPAASVTYRTYWRSFRRNDQGGRAQLDFWDDYSADGKLDAPQLSQAEEQSKMASLASSAKIGPGETKEFTFLITWHFPNRYTWDCQRKTDPGKSCSTEGSNVGNFYATQYKDAWDVAEKTMPQLEELEKRTIEFVDAFCKSNLPEIVKEAALFNVSTLRTQTCFRTKDGYFFGWEGCHNEIGCCPGSCTHVWNYEQATAFLFGDLAKLMREIEFGYATSKQGCMSFRVKQPIDKNAQQHAKAAADGQMGCIMKMYRDWQLSGDDKMLRKLWPNVKKALEFCWVEGGWDANKDGVMEGAQHNTMDVEYFGPNPQMGLWYLGALRAGEEMAKYLGDDRFAKTCRRLFEKGSKWIDANLFNGEYYIHKIQPPQSKDKIEPSLIFAMVAQDLPNPSRQLGKGCLVDQLVGQYMAHVLDLGYLVKSENIKKTLQSIMKYNYRNDLSSHFNCMRSYALGNEAALLMAAYPDERPAFPFPFFTEVMTGFEYTAAIGMLYEGQRKNGLLCIKNIRDRYDGKKRSPFDEAECGHHYARAMASWAAVLALTGFHYSGVEKTMTFAPVDGQYFWSNGYAWGKCLFNKAGKKINVKLSVLYGQLPLSKFIVKGFGEKDFKEAILIKQGKTAEFTVKAK